MNKRFENVKTILAWQVRPQSLMRMIRHGIAVARARSNGLTIADLMTPLMAEALS